MNGASLHLRPLGIDTHQEFVIYMHRDCHVCRAEGFEAQTRVEVNLRDRQIIATLNLVSSDLLQAGEASLSLSAWRALSAKPNDEIVVSHAPTLDSLSAMRAKIYGHRLDAFALHAIINDIAAARYSDLHIAAFLSACAGGRMDVQETIDLTRAMVDAGESIHWGKTPIGGRRFNPAKNLVACDYFSGRYRRCDGNLNAC
jgi:thymidine phosphorylase